MPALRSSFEPGTEPTGAMPHGGAHSGPGRRGNGNGGDAPAKDDKDRWDDREVAGEAMRRRWRHHRAPGSRGVWHGEGGGGGRGEENAEHVT